MFCPQCGTKTEQLTKFCKSCGLKLSEHERLLKDASFDDVGNIEKYRRENRMYHGLLLTMSSFVMMAIFFLIFGLRATGYIPRGEDSLIRPFIASLAMSTIPGTIGFILLFASGYFKNLKERRLRTDLALLELKRKALEEASHKSQAFLPHEKHDVEASHIAEHTARELQSLVSIAEPTTRQLQSTTSDSAKIG